MLYLPDVWSAMPNKAEYDEACAKYAANLALRLVLHLLTQLLYSLGRSVCLAKQIKILDKNSLALNTQSMYSHLR